MHLYVVGIDYNTHFSFRNPEDASALVNIMLRAKKVNEVHMNDSSGWVPTEHQPKIESFPAQGYDSAEQLEKQLGQDITFWIDTKRHSVRANSIAMETFMKLANVEKTHKVFRKKGSDLEAVDISKGWGSVKVKDGEEYVTQR